MHDLTLWVAWGVYAILILLVAFITVAAVLVCLLWGRVDVGEQRRRGEVAREVETERTDEQRRAEELTRILLALVAVTDSVEAMRGQNSAEHSALQRLAVDTNQMLRRLLARLGFLPADQPPPPYAKHLPDEPPRD